MSNQASADLDQANPDDFAGLADAGLGDGGAWEGREDAPSSATQYEAAPDDAHAPDGSGREGGADEQEEEITALEQYWKTVEDLDLDNLPADEPPAVEQTAAESAEEEDDEPTAEGDKAPQYRFRPTDEVERLAFALRKADKSISIADAVDIARSRLGVTPAPAAAAEPAASDQTDTADDADSDQPTSADLQSQIVALRRQVLDAKEAYDVDTEVSLARQILDLEEQLPQVRAAEQARQAAAAEADEAWNQALDASWQAVVAEYPEAAEENSPFAARMAEIDESAGEAAELGNDKAKALFTNPDKARIIADLVAKERGVKPASAAPAAPATPISKGRSLPAPASSRSSSPASRPGPAVVRPASGAARTAADSPTSFDVALSRVRSLEDYEVVKDQLLASLA